MITLSPILAAITPYEPPPPVSGRLLPERFCIGPFCNLINSIPSNDPNANSTVLGLIGNAAAKFIVIFITFAGIAVFLYLMWGAWDYLSSGGDKEKIAKAQAKMTTAVIGIILVFVMLMVYGLIVGDVLGIIIRTDTGWTIRLPSLAP